jgi:hypothetical protein
LRKRFKKQVERQVKQLPMKEVKQRLRKLFKSLQERLVSKRRERMTQLKRGGLARVMAPKRLKQLVVEKLLGRLVLKSWQLKRSPLRRRGVALDHPRSLSKHSWRLEDFQVEYAEAPITSTLRLSRPSHHTMATTPTLLLDQGVESLMQLDAYNQNARVLIGMLMSRNLRHHA